MRIFNVQSSIINLGLNLLLPRFCLGCKLEGTDFCADCLHNLRPRPMMRRDGFESLAGVLTLAPYGEPVVRNLIQTWKYDRVTPLADPVAVFIRRGLGNAKALLDVDLVVPVPLHWFREKERGFNQATAIARVVGETLGLPMLEGALERVRRTESQSQVQHESGDRAKNVQAAFGIEDPGAIAGKRCLLVDDVITSGHTMDACARVLKDAGATSVWGFAIARG